MRKILASLSLVTLLSLILPTTAFAEGGVFASGGGNKTAGSTFTVTVTASGATFDSLQGTISISGPVDVVSFSAGGATWLPGKTPSNGGQFVGIVTERNSLTVATIKLRGKTPGSGSVSVSGVKLADKGSVVGTGAGSASFTIQRAPQLPNAPSITSTSHPDQSLAYEATTVVLNWNKDKGVDGFAYLFDQATGTDPGAKINTSDATITFADQKIGTYFFHLKAHNADGWGSASEFKVTIKEPDAKVDDTLAKPSGIKVEKLADFVNNITDGTVTGIKISGIIVPNYTANITLDPTLVLPAEKTLSAKSDDNGKFELIIDFPLRAGRYKLTIQGILEKKLTPVSDEVLFEISQAKGGTINLLTGDDQNPPKVEAKVKGWKDKYNWFYVSVGVVLLWLLTVVALIIILVLRTKKRSVLKIQNSANSNINRPLK